MPACTQSGERGFWNALKLVMRLKEGGLCWMAVVCSSFVFANISRHQRSPANPYGDLEYEPVHNGNAMADIACLFLEICMARGIFAVIENPAGSQLFAYPRLEELLHQFKAIYQCTDGCAWSQRSPGMRFLKKFKFAAAAPQDQDVSWIQRICAKCSCPGGVHLELMTTNEKGQVSGNAHLKASQAYPAALGRAIVAAWQKEKKIAQRNLAKNLKVASPVVLKVNDWKTPAGSNSCQSSAPTESSSSSGSWKTPLNPMLPALIAPKSADSAKRSADGAPTIQSWKIVRVGL